MVSKWLFLHVSEMSLLSLILNKLKEGNGATQFNKANLSIHYFFLNHLRIQELPKERIKSILALNVKGYVSAYLQRRVTGVNKTVVKIYINDTMTYFSFIF